MAYLPAAFFGAAFLAEAFLVAAFLGAAFLVAAFLVVAVFLATAVPPSATTSRATFRQLGLGPNLKPRVAQTPHTYLPKVPYRVQPGHQDLQGHHPKTTFTLGSNFSFRTS